MKKNVLLQLVQLAHYGLVEKIFHIERELECSDLFTTDKDKYDVFYREKESIVWTLCDIQEELKQKLTRSSLERVVIELLNIEQDITKLKNDVKKALLNETIKSDDYIKDIVEILSLAE